MSLSALADVTIKHYFIVNKKYVGATTDTQILQNKKSRGKSNYQLRYERAQELSKARSKKEQKKRNQQYKKQVRANANHITKSFSKLSLRARGSKK